MPFLPENPEKQYYILAVVVILGLLYYWGVWAMAMNTIREKPEFAFFFFIAAIGVIYWLSSNKSLLERKMLDPRMCFMLFKKNTSEGKLFPCSLKDIDFNRVFLVGNCWVLQGFRNGGYDAVVLDATKRNPTDSDTSLVYQELSRTHRIDLKEAEKIVPKAGGITENINEVERAMLDKKIKRLEEGIDE